MIRSHLRILLIPACILLIPCLLIVGCQSKLIYYPRPYPAGAVSDWQTRTQGTPVDFSTSQGRQRAFLQGNRTNPRNLWIVCGGNGTLALDWSSWIDLHAPKQDAWLLVDFPGYGQCEGSPNPRRIRETFQTLVPIASESVGLSKSPPPSRLRIFGHSLGAAACLIAATEFDIHNGVLLSPFTSTMDMGQKLIGLPIGFLVTHRFDNAARLDDLISKAPTRITLLHGTHDEVIPVSMSRTLAHGRSPSIRLIEIRGGRHNNIPEQYSAPLARALEESGNTTP